MVVVGEEVEVEGVDHQMNLQREEREFHKPSLVERYSTVHMVLKRLVL